MIVRLKVPFDNGKVKCEAGEITDELEPGYAARLVRSGLADEMPNNEGLNVPRKKAGMAPLKTRQRKIK